MMVPVTREALWLCQMHGGRTASKSEREIGVAFRAADECEYAAFAERKETTKIV